MKTLAKKSTIVTMHGQQNENMLTSLQVAYSASLQLVQDGFTILDVCIRNSRPVIKIQNCAKCANLASATSVFSRDKDGQQRRKVSLVKSAQVEWIVRGH